VLQHGTLPLCGDITRILSYLSLSAAEREAQRQMVRLRATTLEESLGRALAFAQVASALADGFSRALGLGLEPGQLTASEQAWAARLHGQRYATSGWTRRA
jgi:lipoate-protein ligase A